MTDTIVIKPNNSVATITKRALKTRVAVITAVAVATIATAVAVIAVANQSSEDAEAGSEAAAE